MNEPLKKEIGFILKDFLKVVKVVSMYPENNPLPQSMRRSFAEKLVSLVNVYGAFRIRVDKDALECKGEIVYRDRSKEEALAQLFFETGITEFGFQSGLDVDGVYRLLDAVRIYLNTPDRSQDLVGLIWEAGINGFVFETLKDVALSEYDSNFDVREYLKRDDAAPAGGGQFGLDSIERYSTLFNPTDDPTTTIEQASLDDSGEMPSGTQVQRVTGSSGIEPRSTFFETVDEDEDSSPEAADAGVNVPIELTRALGLGEPSGGTGRKTDVKLHLYGSFTISEEEEETIRSLLEEDTSFDPYESTLEMLKEFLLMESELAGLDEAVTICEKIINEFVAAGKLIEAGALLSHLKKLQESLEQQKPAWSERLKEAGMTAGSRERLAVLADSLNTHPDIGVTEIKRYLDSFGWEALSGITDLVGEFEHEHHREALKDYLTSRGQDNIDIVAKGVFDKRWQVVRNSVTILARIGDARALRYLERVVDHEEPLVRMELVTALKDCPSTEALGLLQSLVADSDRTIRRQAVEAIVARSGSTAFETIGALIDDENLPSLDHDDQQALLNAYSLLGGEQAVAYLSQMILRYNLLRDARLVFCRTAAFEALSFNASERGERMLVRLSSSWRPDIRRQASYALQRRRENIFGQEV